VQWLETPREFPGVLGMLSDLAAHLATLHGTGHVHRDLKPENVLLMLQTQAWKLIDFGIAAPAGALPAPCSLRALPGCPLHLQIQA
jgi:eukaryotic-like serine/threonine-protein kinase